MNNGRGWQIVAVVPRIRDSLTLGGVDMIREPPVELAHLIDYFARYHDRGAGNVTSGERLRLIAVAVQEMLARVAVVWKKLRDDRARAKKRRTRIGQRL